MESLVGYGSDDENEYEIPSAKLGHQSWGRSGHTQTQPARPEDDTNYEEVNMDMSEDSNNDSGSETRESKSRDASGHARSDASRDRDYRREDTDLRRQDRDYRREDIDYRKHDMDDRVAESSENRDRDRRYTDRGEKSNKRDRSSRDGRSSGRDAIERHSRRYDRDGGSKKGLVGEHPASSDSHDIDERESSKVPALMELKPFDGAPPPGALSMAQNRETDRSDREITSRRDRDKNGDRERDRSDKDKRDRRDRDRDSDRDRHRRRDDDRHRRRSRSRSRDKSRDKEREGRGSSRRSNESWDKDKAGSSQRSSSHERKHSHGSTSPNSGEYRPSYKVSKKLQVMEKMGLQIKTPDGSMATAQMLLQRSVAEQRAPAANTSNNTLPSYYNPSAVNAARYADQVQKRKLLWGNKSKEITPAAEVAPVAPAPNPNVSKWTGARFSQDNDGKVVNKFMRLMGIKDPEVVQATVSNPDPSSSDVVKKQEEMFQAMQAQYDVARATTHTMRGVGLGFSSSGYKF